MSRGRQRVVLAAILGALAAAGCLELRDDGSSEAGACEACHPAAALGGAHGAHLVAGTYSRPFACDACHPVPAGAGADAAHRNGEVDVVFPEGGLASARGGDPAWDGTTCTGVYCHGATIGGGGMPEPGWSWPGDMPCASCHGRPPPPPHVQTPECGDCHEATYGDGALDLDRHLNGAVDGEDVGGEDGVPAR